MLYMYKEKEDQINIGREDSKIQYHLEEKSRKNKPIPMSSLVNIHHHLYTQSLYLVPLPPKEPKIRMTFLSKDIKNDIQ